MTPEKIFQKIFIQHRIPPYSTTAKFSNINRPSLWWYRNIIKEIFSTLHNSCNNNRGSCVKICMDNNFTCLLLSVYMPCDNI